ncbi:unnamed protein product [Vitrella brassicaformis CCMP3155]|uniref:Uncharacterized protein n=1 Tax=Vitrella brassicaformis (strain CCMP3155) TaxID=1169540 RepID=A0A0G4G703_VITBC|nr:unnamed protein product [Vitrella brassicaformis CCMP3155]|eukprot:CEM24490.1 unnamed protein product [Vitrella brassicaformis CCMP3155]
MAEHQQDPISIGTHRPLTFHEALRRKKQLEQNSKALKNRISYFKREEEKIWRDLDEVRRHASRIEDGRARTLEKKMADKAISHYKESEVCANKDKAAQQRMSHSSSRQMASYEFIKSKQQSAENTRAESQDYLRQKKMMEADTNLRNSNRAMVVHRERLLAKKRIDGERARRLQELKGDQEERERALFAEVMALEAQLPELEATEGTCLQRLQNSRVVSHSILEDLERSLGSRGGATSSRNSLNASLRAKTAKPAFRGTSARQYDQDQVIYTPGGADSQQQDSDLIYHPPRKRGEESPLSPDLPEAMEKLAQLHVTEPPASYEVTSVLVPPMVQRRKIDEETAPGVGIEDDESSADDNEHQHNKQN